MNFNVNMGICIRFIQFWQQICSLRDRLLFVKRISFSGFMWTAQHLFYLLRADKINLFSFACLLLWLTFRSWCENGGNILIGAMVLVISNIPHKSNPYFATRQKSCLDFLCPFLPDLINLLDKNFFLLQCVANQIN